MTKMRGKGLFTTSSLLAMESIHPYVLSHRFVKFRGYPTFYENPVLDRPASPANRLFRPFLPKWVGPVETIIEHSARLEFPVDFFHLFPAFQIPKSITFILNGVVVEKPLPRYDRNF